MKLWNLFGVVPLLLCKAIAGESTNTIKNGIVPSVNGKRPSASGHRPIDNHLSIPIHPMTELRHKLNIFHSTPLNKWLQRFDMQFGGDYVNIYRIIAFQISITCNYANVTHNYSYNDFDSVGWMFGQNLLIRRFGWWWCCFIECIDAMMMKGFFDSIQIYQMQPNFIANACDCSPTNLNKQNATKSKQLLIHNAC